MSMQRKLCDILVCPECQGGLDLIADPGSDETVESGSLSCLHCGKDYPVRKGIPRFVSDDEDYCRSFGWQWARFRHTQIDAFNGTDESARRFRAETGWQPSELQGLMALDAGCGAGRFSAVTCEWGARVLAVDLTSGAVEACARNMHELAYDVDVVQASLYRLPFRPNTFDRVFSLGVLHHTPDPNRAMRTLPLLLKPGGELAYWIYEKRWTRFLMLRNYLRWITRRLPLKATYALTGALVSFFFPLTLALSRVPHLRRALPLLPIASRHGRGSLSLRQQWEWTLLDTFDSYSPIYEFPQSEVHVRAALLAAGLEEVHRTSARGMAIVGRKPKN